MTNPTFILPSSPGIAANNLYALKVGNQPERFSPISGTFARSTTASRQNANGLIESIGINTPRLDYTYGSCPALLLEPQRTNLYLYSNDFSNVFWLKNNVSITSNSSTSPDGNINATTLIGNGTSIPKNIVQNISVTLGVTYTITFFARKNTNSFVQIATSSATFASTSFANFDLNNGIVGTVGSTATATIQSMGNGWYRCSMTATATATASGGAGIYLISASNSVRAEVNTLSTDIYIYGFQLEQGSFPTTYIPTTSAAVTRTADTFSYSNIYTNGYVSSQGGTWLIELKNNVSYVRDISVVGIFIGDSNSGLTNSFAISALGGGGRLRIGKFLSNIYTQLYLTTTDNVKIAIKWNGATADIFVNGVKQVSTTVFTATFLEYLYHSTSSEVPKFIQQMALFNTPLSDAECVLLTSDTYGSFATLASSTSYTLS